MHSFWIKVLISSPPKNSCVWTAYLRKQCISSCVNHPLPPSVLALAITSSSLAAGCSTSSSTSLSSSGSSSSSSPPSVSLSQRFLLRPFLRWLCITDSMTSTTVSPSQSTFPLCLSGKGWFSCSDVCGGGDGRGEGRGCLRGRPGPRFFTMLFPVRACLWSFFARRILLTWCRLFLGGGRWEWCEGEESRQHAGWEEHVEGLAWRLEGRRAVTLPGWSRVQWERQEAECERDRGGGGWWWWWCRWWGPSETSGTMDCPTRFCVPDTFPVI